MDDLCCGSQTHCVSLSLSQTNKHSHTNTASTIKPLASLEIGDVVAVTHQFLLVLLHQAVKAVPTISLEILLLGFNLQERNKKGCEAEQNRTTCLTNFAFKCLETCVVHTLLWEV